MSTNVHPTYEDKSEAMSRAAQRAIVKPVKLADADSKPAKLTPAKALQEQLQFEFVDGVTPSGVDNRVQQAVLIAIIAGATWVLGFALYANL